MLRDPASRRPVVAVPQVIALDEADNGLDAFQSENTPNHALAPVTRQVEPAVAARGSLAATVQSFRERLPSRPQVRLSKAIAPAAITALALASLGLPAVSLLTASPGAVPLSGGAVTITSEPPGRTVRIDGVYRGVTPFATMLVSGMHGLEIGDAADIRARQLHVRPGADVQFHVSWTPPLAEPDTGAAVAKPTMAVEAGLSSAPAKGASGSPAAASSVPSEPMLALVAAPTRPAPAPLVAAGTLAVTSPFPVRVLVDGVEIGTDSTPRLSVAAGAHTIRLVNERLEFDQPMDVTVAAKRTHPLVVAPPQGTLHINAAPWAHVWIDGRRAGDTPIANLTLPIGEHDLLLRHPELGEERRTITVGARTPVRVGVELGR